MQRIKINNCLFTAKVVDDPESIALGMMGKTFDKTFNAMLFVLNKTEPEAYSSNHYIEFTSMNEKKENQCFWMRNCIIPLDMIFIKKGRITKIHHLCPPCDTKTCKNYCGIGTMVLEVNGGICKTMNITEGNFVDFV
jgi:uncharacterized membrane protein (UPF0127 family)